MINIERVDKFLEQWLWELDLALELPSECTIEGQHKINELKKFLSQPVPVPLRVICNYWFHLLFVVQYFYWGKFFPNKRISGYNRIVNIPRWRNWQAVLDC